MAIRGANESSTDFPVRERTTGAIDKLDVRIPGDTALTAHLQTQVRRGIVGLRWPSIQSTRHYAHAINLGYCGLRSTLFLEHRRSGDHKLEITGAGTMAFSELIAQVSSAFVVDPLKVEIMRIDLAVDIPAYSVGWFRQNARVTHKRYTTEYGRFRSEHRQFETLCFGKRPNLIRIYDKCEKQRIEYQALKKQNEGRPLPSFEQLYGHPEEAIFTRIERQYGGGRVPSDIATLGKLRQNALDLNPYKSLRFSPIIISDDSLNALSGDLFIRGQGICRLMEKYGLQETKKLIDDKTCRNGARVLRQFERVLAPAFTNVPPDVQAIFGERMYRQLNG